MAPAKKNVTVNKEETKPAARKAPVSAEPAGVEAPKAEEVKAEAPKAEKKSEAKTAEKKKPGRKPAVKAAEKKADEAKPAEKEEAETKSAGKKAEVGKELKSEITVQFDGKSYSQEELVQIAKDVWKYDLGQQEADLTSVELYVKPEEHVAYYVMNKEFAGSFYL